MISQTQLQALTNTPPPTTTAPSATLGEDDFLKLLIQELQNQDPLNPMSGSDYAAQLAQFSSVEQLSNINTTLQNSVTSNQQLTQSISNSLAATFIGKQVKASESSFDFTSGTVQLGYSLPSAAESTQVKIVDATGTVVKTINGAPGDSGDNTFTWDGTNDLGQAVQPGQYSFSVSATDENGVAIQSSNFIFGQVSGVRYKSDGTYFVLGDIEVPLSDILEITNE